MLVALETVVMNPFLGVFFSFRHETVVFSQADKAVNLCVVVSGDAGAGGGFSGWGLVDGGAEGGLPSLVLFVATLLVLLGS